MNVNKRNLQSLFAMQVRYEIPRFQRSYVWNQDDQWEPLWEDVRNTAERYLDHRAGGMTASVPAAHFLGAVVLQQQPTATGTLETRLVVDGQQRLTTLQLLLDAVQEVFQEDGIGDAAIRLEVLVLNPEAFRDGNPDRAFKVWPTMADEDAFRHAMHNELPSETYGESRIVQAHEFFKLQTAQWLGGQPQEKRVRAEALEHAVKNLMELVVIDLEQSDDPHVIFETLNARGTPLLDSDLIKNMVLHESGQAGIASDSERGDTLWGFQDNWWKKEIRQGRLYRPRIDVFLNYWLTMRKQDEVVADAVFREFREYYGKEKRPIEDIAADLGAVGKCYRLLEEASDPEMATFLYRWGVMQAGVLTPILLWLLSSEVPKEQIDRCLRALESHQVRRMICRMSTMGHNRLFISLIGLLKRAGAQVAGETVVEYLRGQTSNVGLWPSDIRMEDAFVTLPLYRLLTRGRLRVVLEGVEEELRTDKAEDRAVPRNLTIEHIMPQQWRQHWPLPAEVGDDVEEKTRAAEKRDRLIHSIGNLTLVSSKLNPTLSNAPWEEKRETLNRHTTLFLNKDLLTEAPDVWDEAAIEERAKRLCHAAARVWPHTDDI